MSQAQRAVHAEELARAGADRAAATAEAQLDAVKENHDAERKGLQVCVGVRVRFIVAASDLHPTHPHQPTHSAQGEIEQLTASLRAADSESNPARMAALARFEFWRIWWSSSSFSARRCSASWLAWARSFWSRRILVTSFSTDVSDSSRAAKSSFRSASASRLIFSIS